MPRKIRPLHVWAPGIRDDTGGIQAFSRFLVRALLEAFPEHPVRVMVRNEALNADDPLLSIPRLKIHTMAGLASGLRAPGLALSGLFQGIKDRPACALTTHMHFLPPLHVLRSLTGTPFAGVLHGIEAWGNISAVRRHALGEADQIFAVSRYTREKVITDHNVDSSRVRVLPNTFDESRYQPGEKPLELMQRLGIQPGQKVMLTVSRLSASERYKGHDMVLRALARLSEVEPGLCYIIAGEGEYKEALRQLAAELGVTDRVYFPGFIPSAELPDYYRLCDLFIMPSTKEGFGIVFMEAMAAGKPVIGGNVDGSADALADGELGVLVSPEDVDQIARDILRVLRHEHPNALLYDPKRLRRAVCDRFGWNAFVKNVSTLVKPLMR